MTKKIFSALKVSALALLLSFGLSYVYAWTAPTLNPPAGNVSAPINTSATAQTKAGGLIVGAATSTTMITSPKYCIGTSCITTWPAGGVADNMGNESADRAMYLNNYSINGVGSFFHTSGNYFYLPGPYSPGYGVSAGGLGKVLTSDASGYASWQTPAAGGGVTSINPSGAGITAVPTTGAVTVTNTGVTGLTAGTGITLSPAGPGATGVVTVNAAAPPTYKGFYQVDDLNACRISNVATGGCSCPGGSSPTQIGQMTVMAVRNPAVLVWGAMYACRW